MKGSMEKLQMSILPYMLKKLEFMEIKRILKTSIS